MIINTITRKMYSQTKLFPPLQTPFMYVEVNIKSEKTNFHGNGKMSRAHLARLMQKPCLPFLNAPKHAPKLDWVNTTRARRRKVNEIGQTHI